MHVLTVVAVSLVVALHLWFLVLEMFLWRRPLGRRVFGLDPEFAARSAALAANQGVYNGFLAAGLIWGLWLGSGGVPILLFFLACVVVAGVFGGMTANRRILLIQAAPGLVALLLVWFSSR